MAEVNLTSDVASKLMKLNWHKRLYGQAVFLIYLSTRHWFNLLLTHNSPRGFELI